MCRRAQPCRRGRVWSHIAVDVGAGRQRDIVWLRVVPSKVGRLCVSLRCRQWIVVVWQWSGGGLARIAVVAVGSRVLGVLGLLRWLRHGGATPCPAAGGFLVVGEAVAGLARSRVVVAPAQECSALSAHASMDNDNALRRLPVARMLAELAGFVAMLLALALCRVRRILGRSGWRRAEPKSVLGISTARGSCAVSVGQSRLRQEQWIRHQHIFWLTVEVASGRKSRRLRAADVGVYDHLRRERPTGTLVASCGLHRLMDSQMSISGSKTCRIGGPLNHTKLDWSGRARLALRDRLLHGGC